MTSELFLNAMTYNERRFGRNENELLKRFRDQPDMMKAVRGRASGLLSTYFTTAKFFAADVLHAIFSTNLGTRTEFPADKIEACQTMLGVARGQALLDQTHPLCQEYPPLPGGGVPRVFPCAGAAGVQYVNAGKLQDKESETSKFLLALGGSCCPFCCSEYIHSNHGMRKFMSHCCWQAASRTGGSARAGMICGPVRTTPSSLIPPRSTSSSQHCTTSSSRR